MVDIPIEIIMHNVGRVNLYTYIVYRPCIYFPMAILVSFVYLIVANKIFVEKSFWQLTLTS